MEIRQPISTEAQIGAGCHTFLGYHVEKEKKKKNQPKITPKIPNPTT